MSVTRPPAGDGPPRRSFLRLVGSVLGAGLGVVAFGGTAGGAPAGSRPGSGGAGAQWWCATECALVACKYGGGGCSSARPNYFRCTDWCGGGTYYTCASWTCRNHCFAWC